jgi:hypothetical protein
MKPPYIFALLLLVCLSTHRLLAEDSGYPGSAPAPSAAAPVSGILVKEAEEKGAKVEIPPGPSEEEASEMWHLSEGADPFPLKFLQNLTSVTSKEPGTLLVDGLDKKFGIIRDNIKGPYALPYVGMTASMSDQKPGESDLLIPPGKTLNEMDRTHASSKGGTSIPFVGTNCTFCHTAQISLNGKTHILEGGPGVLNVRGFFQDIAGSLVKTMLDEKTMREFLERAVYPNDKIAARRAAKDFTNRYMKALGLATDGRFKAAFKAGVVGAVRLFDRFADTENVTAMKVAAVKDALFKNRDITQKFLTELLQMSYPEMKVNNTINARMEWLARLMGTDPSIKTTQEINGSMDAFARITNLSLRRDDPGPLTGLVSIPSIWATKYRDFFHWNANTNSISYRDAGQAIGLGAVVIDEQGNTTINFENLHKEQELLYKIKVPNWQALGGNVEMDKAIRGCSRYQKTCAQCHDSNKERVGPTKSLINYKMFGLKRIGTDPNQTLNQAVPVRGVPFRQALFGSADIWLKRFYEENKVPPERQCLWEEREKRGTGYFRDTVFGEASFPTDSEMAYFNIDRGMGYPARGLAGAWATAPFLHNGSVPSIEALLSPSTERPKVFLVRSNEIDPDTLGFKNSLDSFPFTDADKKKIAELRKKSLKNMAPANSDYQAKLRYIRMKYPETYFDSSQAGNSNAGHEGPEFGTTLLPEQKKELIEFLKIIRPESEYSWDTPPTYVVNGLSCEKAPAVNGK